MRIKLMLLCILTGCIFSPVQAADHLDYVGVYEGGLSYLDNKPDFSRTKLLFSWDGSKWTSVQEKKTPKKIKWHLFGLPEQLAANRSSNKRYGIDQYLYTINPTQNKPLTPKNIEHHSYVGWSSAFTYLPQILTTREIPLARLDYNLAIISTDMKRELISRIKPLLEQNPLCDAESNPRNQLDEKAFRIKESYQNGAAAEVRYVIALEPVEVSKVCGPDPIVSLWFYIARDRMELVGTNLELIGHTNLNDQYDDEWVFWYSGYNQDGYILFSEDFRQQAKFLWQYH